jgi:hypothetical protein
VYRPTISPYIVQLQEVARDLQRTSCGPLAPGGGWRSYNGASSGWAQPDDSPAGAFEKRSAGWDGSTEDLRSGSGFSPARVTASRGGLMFDENSDIDDLVCRTGARPICGEGWLR